MDEIKYKSIEECKAAIDTLVHMGIPIPEWLSKQYEAFKNLLTSETLIWDTLKLYYPYGIMPDEKIKCVEEAVDLLLEEGPEAEKPGLLLGKIQCGKTDTFEDIIGLAFDKGIDIAIVLTKGTNPLVEQTVLRMKEDYRHFKPSPTNDPRTTIRVYDIMKKWDNITQATIEKSKIVFVCKKEKKNLDHLAEMFEKDSSFMRNKKVLIVDDEADFASRNYETVKAKPIYDEEGNPVSQEQEIKLAKVSEQIDNFRESQPYCRYLQVTATPYCLYLQPNGMLNLDGKVVKPFRPRFTKLVPVHDAYIGGKEYFELSENPDSMYSYLFHQVDEKCLKVLRNEDKRYINKPVSSGNLYDLTYAIIAYFVGTAIRRIQEQADYKTSAVIHVETNKKYHEWQFKLVERLINDIRKAIVEESMADKRVWNAVDAAYEDFKESNSKGREEGLIKVDFPDKEDVLDEIRRILNPTFENFKVQKVNSDNNMKSLLDEETGELELPAAANIFIGGNILDRGVTIKNMICFFYGRNPSTFQEDTILQHSRMYGARSKKDMAVTRFHTTAAIYKILKRINTLDDQLREWFVKGNDQTIPNAVFIGFDKNIKPCATSKIKASNTLTLKNQMRVLPIGMQTGRNEEIGRTIKKIDEIITSAPFYHEKDSDGFFEIDKETVVEILNLIYKTYRYAEDWNNVDRKNDIKEMLCALEYCTEKSGGKIYALHRTDRDMGRIRENGGFINAPEDGRTDLEPARKKAQDAPVVMFFKEKGKRKKEWRGAPFYWPVLLTQENIDPVMYSMSQSRKKKVAAVDLSRFFEDIDPKEVLALTYKGDLEEHFGAEGSEYDGDECPIETRAIKDSTASRYLEKDADGNWKLNPDVTVDKENYHGLYSLNGGDFPFVLREYRYMFLRNKRDGSGDLILLELADQSEWDVIPVGCLDEKGDLRDRDSKKVLLHGTDTIYSKDMKRREFVDETITQWVIEYPIIRVLKFQKNTIDWDAIFGDDEEEE